MESFYPVSLSYRFAVLVALAEFQLLSSPVRVVAVVFLGADGQRFIIAECSLGQHSHTRAHTHTPTHTLAPTPLGALSHTTHVLLVLGPRVGGVCGGRWLLPGARPPVRSEGRPSLQPCASCCCGAETPHDRPLKGSRCSSTCEETGPHGGEEGSPMSLWADAWPWRHFGVFPSLLYSSVHPGGARLVSSLRDTVFFFIDCYKEIVKLMFIAQN